MHIKELVQVERLGHKVKIRVDFGHHFVKSPWIQPEQAPRMVCRLLAGKIQSLVKQRKYQFQFHLATKPPGADIAIVRLENKLAYQPVWNCMHLRRVLKSMLEDLKCIAPVGGKYQGAWQELIIALELFTQEEDIKRKINELVYG